MKKYKSPIEGHLDIIVADYEEEYNGITERWNEVMIHGDPEGLRSLAKLLLKLADFDQENSKALPVDAREHEHLRPKFDLSMSSAAVVIGRLDAKGTGEFYRSYIPK